MSGKKPTEIYVLHGKNVLRSCDGMVPTSTEDTIALSFAAMERKTIGIVCTRCHAMNRLSIAIFPALYTGKIICCRNPTSDMAIAYGPTKAEDPDEENCPECDKERASGSK